MTSTLYQTLRSAFAIAISRRCRVDYNVPIVLLHDPIFIKNPVHFCFLGDFVVFGISTPDR